eukprot:9474989-Pyramimonas_sp.AAC.1
MGHLALGSSARYYLIYLNVGCPCTFTRAYASYYTVRMKFDGCMESLRGCNLKTETVLGNGVMASALGSSCPCTFTRLASSYYIYRYALNFGPATCISLRNRSE